MNKGPNMTAEQLAARMVAQWEHGDEKHRQWLRDIAIPDISAALDEAVAEMRERCIQRLHDAPANLPGPSSPFRDGIRYSIDAIRALPPGPGVERRCGTWLPIETAHPDTDVLLGWWQTCPERAWKQKVGWARASNTCGPQYNNGWLDGEATHWTPLPEPPKETP